MKKRFFIDSHKGFTGIIVLILMAAYNQWDNTTAWVYLALHGSYGLLWNLKSKIFPDRQWEQSTPLWWGIVYYWGGLTFYLSSAYLITSRGTQVPPWLLALAIFLYAIGVFYHFSTDMQKHIALQLQPGKLITDGMMANTRNLNYWGEFLIYGSFALLAMHWFPFVFLLGAFFVEWLPNMRRKDQSLSRYPEFSVYKKQTKRFIPRIW
jgi:steroid 5-alpha reductase family enzyme